VLGNILGIVTIAFLAGIFFMQGVLNWVRGEWLAWLLFLGIPCFAVVIVILTRRILREIR
jgi:hypothetical protein